MLITLGRGMAPHHVTNTTKTLAGQLPSCVFDIDATQASSYSGTGQTVMNLAPSPADGAVQAAYNFYLGVDGATGSDDPTFTGTPGTPSAYFAFDGDDTMVPVGGNTAYLNNLPKTTGGGLPVTMALAFRAVDETSLRAYMGGYVSNQPQVRLLCASNEQIRLSQGDGSAAANSSTRTLTPGTDYVLIFTLDAAGNWQSWLNGTKTSGSMSLISNITDSGPFRIMHSAGNGMRLYAASLYNTALNDAQAALLRDIYRARHQRDYGG